MTPVYIALVMSSLALIVSVGAVLYLVIDYRASRDAGEVIEAARQAFEPYTRRVRRPK